MLFCLRRSISVSVFLKIRRLLKFFFFFLFRLLYQQQSMWMATFWLSQTTCLYTTIPNTEGGLAALTPQKVRLLLIWKMVGTHLHVFFFICNAFFFFFFYTILYVDTPLHLFFHNFFSHQSNHPLKKSISISQPLSTRIRSLLNLLLTPFFI